MGRLPVKVVAFAVAFSSGPAVGCGHSQGTVETSPVDGGAEADAPPDVPGEAAIDAPPPVAVDVELGRAHTCARMSDGTARCWGWNYVSQLGDQTRDSRSRPVVAFGVKGADEISVGGNHACVRTAERKLICWGGNAGGQVGDPTEVLWTLRPSSKILPATMYALQISMGGAHSCARLDGNGLACWGSNRAGQLGYNPDAACTTFTLGDTPCSLAPKLVPDVTDVAEVATGDGHTCVRKIDDSVWCWGRNSGAQLGGLPLAEIGPRTKVVGLTGRPTKLTLGGEHSCALLADATVQCWGRDDEGQLGDGDGGTDGPTPRAVTGLADVSDVVSGLSHTCALGKDGRVRCFGANDGGQLGDGTTTRRRVPTLVPDLDRVKRIGAGTQHTCALRDDGAILCWGANSDGQLGDGTIVGHPKPGLVAW